MTSASSTRPGPYEIVAALGVGGMGELYKVRDTRAERTVAVQVVAAELNADPDSRPLLERAPRTIPALNHPHMCAPRDVGERRGTSDASPIP